ncbi:MAG: hypothetical protein HYX27_07065 [Acidobacteria bacterium]|nr:hypothetical protein [Acidobacteriota bacterium]
MHLICRRCGSEVEHACSPSKAMGESVMPCALKGALWVYVTDMAGNGIEGVGVSVDRTNKRTDKIGFAGFDPLEPGTARVELTELTGSAAVEFELPEVKTFEASIANGQISMVEFQLSSWIEIYVQDKAGKAVFDLTVKIKLPNGEERTEKLTRDKLTSKNVFRIGKIWRGDCQISFPEVCDAEWAELVEGI